jgi:hypothetical protein
LEIFAKALPRLAESILVDADAKAYGKHNLVADYLIQHHNDLLATKQSGLQYFLGIYRTVNNCGRPPLDATELSDYRISLLVAGKTLDKIELPDDSPTKLSTANSSITPGTASTTAVSRSLNSTFEAVEKTPAEVAPAKSPSPIKIGNFILKVAEATAPARGICGTSFQTAKDFRDAIVPLVNSLKPKEKEPIEPVMPPYKDAPMCFNRTEDEEDLRELDITFNKLNRVESRKKEIKAESLLFVLTDSIRERPLLKSIPTKLPTPPPPPENNATTVTPPDGVAPTFPPAKSDIIDLTANVELDPYKLEHSPEITASIDSLSELVRNIFIIPQAVYINQAAYNIKDAEHSRIANESKLTETAEAVELICASEVKVHSKIVNAALDQKVLVSKSALKKDVNASLQSMSDKLVARMATLEEQVTQDRKKRAELEAEIALLKSSKDNRGPAVGAAQRNQDAASTTPAVHFESESPPTNQSRKRRRPKSQLKQAQNEVQADDANQGDGTETSAEQRRRFRKRSKNRKWVKSNKTNTEQH